jgi:hypothetical protein
MEHWLETGTWMEISSTNAGGTPDRETGKKVARRGKEHVTSNKLDFNLEMSLLL